MEQVDTTNKGFEEVFSRENLAAIYGRLKANKTDQIDGRVKIPPGWDRVTLRRFEKQLNQHLAAIERRARSGRYIFRPFLHHMQPKADGGHRKIAYSGIRDRIVQAALHEILSPAVDVLLTDSAFAYRAGIGTHDAIRTIFTAATGGQPYFVKSDFVKFFDEIDHARLRQLLDQLPLEPAARQLIWRFVRTGDIERSTPSAERAVPSSRQVGVPQGGVISGVLANLYLVDFDHAVRSVSGATLVRYADDFVILCADPAVCAEVFKVVESSAKTALLRLHEGEKTVRQGSINDGLNFVGFRVRGTLVSVKPGNVAKFQQRMAGVVARHEKKLRDGEHQDRNQCLKATVHHVNRKITGLEIDGIPRSWLGYFRLINDVNQLRNLDRWVRGILAALARRIGVPIRNRTDLLALGYRTLIKEYWAVRRAARTYQLRFSGRIPLPPSSDQSRSGDVSTG